MLKKFKITILAPTCFGSRKNNHQGAVLCLTKSTEYSFSVLVDTDAVNVMAAYQPVVHHSKCAVQHTCTTGWCAAITLITSVKTSA